MNNFDEIVNMYLKEDWKSATAAGLLGLSTLGFGNDITPTSNVKTSINAPIGVKNNNPGNIEATGNWKSWGGAVGKNGRFIIFDSPEMGIRAIGRILKTYNKRYNLNTITEIINRWAPPSENNTEQYIKNVSAWTNINKDDKLDLNNKDTMFKLLNAIIRQEVGKSYNSDVVNKAIDLINVDY